MKTAMWKRKRKELLSALALFCIFGLIAGVSIKVLCKFRYAAILPIGECVPDFCLPDLKGAEHCLSEYDGQRICLVFAKPSCQPCQQQLADLIGLREVLRQKNYIIIAVLLERPDGGSALPYLTLLDNSEVYRKLYGGVLFPALFLLDESHVLRFQLVGYRGVAVDSLLPGGI